MAKFSVVVRLKPSEKVANCTLQLSSVSAVPVSVMGKTNSQGAVELDTKSLPDGGYVLAVIAVNTDSGAVGPATANTAVPPDRIFRPMTVDVVLTTGAVTSIAVRAGRFFSGTARVVPKAPVAIAMQPVWIRSPNHSGRSGQL